jgi:hypothetical protein
MSGRSRRVCNRRGSHTEETYFFFSLDNKRKRKKKLKTKNLEDGTSGKNSWQTFKFF